MLLNYTITDINKKCDVEAYRKLFIDRYTDINVYKKQLPKYIIILQALS